MSATSQAIRQHDLVAYFLGIFLLFFSGLVFGCTTSHSTSIPSPDGSLTLVTSINQDRADRTAYLCVKFQIFDKAGQVVYEEQTHASDRMIWTMKWEGDQRLVLESSDIGTYAWEQGTGGMWQAVP